MPQLNPGTVLSGLFRVDKLLGEGGMGAIYEAEDLVLNRRVAVKVANQPAAVEALVAEARALAAIRHPNLPVIHLAGRDQGVDYMVMERLSGTSLEKRLRHVYQLRQPISLLEVLELLMDIADALYAVHEAGIVHRDVKPENVLLCGKRGPVLIDFGLVVPEANLPGNVLHAGSPPYMAPEMITEKSVRGARHLADAYSFGIMAYELLTGSLPFNANTLDALLRLHLDAPIPNVRMLRPDAPLPLATLLSELMAKEPGNRPQTMEEVRWRLQAIANPIREQRPPRVPSVLIITDDPELSQSLEQLLTGWLNRVTLRWAQNSKHTLNALHNGKPQLVLLDLQLHEMSGVELMMHLRGSEAKLPDAIVVVSDSAQPADLDLLRHLGVASVVWKGERLSAALEPIVRNALAATSPSRW